MDSPNAAMARQSPPARAVDASSKPRPKLISALKQFAAESSDSDSGSEDDSPASEQPSSSPPQITAAPAITHKSNGIASNDEESDGEGAYARMKKRLAANKAAAEVPAVPEPVKITTAMESDDEDDMPVLSKARKPLAKTQRPSTPTRSPTPSVRSRNSSPGLFVTPAKSPAARPEELSEGEDSPFKLPKSDLQERMSRIRAERLARQQEQPKKQKKRNNDQEPESGSDGEAGRKLTQQAKPTRKAGKKAMEAMARDQQRIIRNMQLTHQSKTKKKYTTKDLFARMGFNNPHDDGLPTPEASSALDSSDAEAAQMSDTPPTSPPAALESQNEKVPTSALELPNKAEAVVAGIDSPQPTKIDKGKGRAPEFQHLPTPSWMQKTEPTVVRNVQVASRNEMIELSDSEDEAQTIQAKSRFPVFDRLPMKNEQESASLLRLRSLAQLAKSAPKVKKGQKVVTLAEMQSSLAQKARQQANQEREEKIAELRRRGVTIETAEEREKHQREIEDLVMQFEKQRQEDLKLGKAERAEMKKNGEDVGDLPSSDESDGDFVGSEDEKASEDGEDEEEVEADIELSGSEDEEMEDQDDTAAVDEVQKQPDDLIESAEQADVEDAEDEDDDANVPVQRRTANRTRNRVVEDDDDSGDDMPSQVIPTQKATQNDEMAAFGFGNADLGLGLTQMFAGTMADMESGSQSAPTVPQDTEQNSLDFLRSLPDTQPGAAFSQTSVAMMPESQAFMSPVKGLPAGIESQFSLGTSQIVQTSPAFSHVEDFEPTQDAGFSFSRSADGLAPDSTVDTVMLPVAESPIQQRKGKLQRGRKEAVVELSDVEEDLVDDADVEEEEDDIQRPPKPTRDAFSKLQKAAKKQRAIEDFNKKTSMAKEAVMEQAEESEDEYAGLGGASDDEEGEEDEELKQMIDHNDVNVDERQLAAFFADKAKKDDEKNIAELYKKIQTGGLRRHAAGREGFDMSDSEDEAERRQRRRRAEFTKNVNELLKDDRVKDIAKDDKKKAFFNTLADFADEGEYDFLDMPAELNMLPAESQSQEDVQMGDTAEEVIPDSQVDAESMPAPTNPLKRKSPDSQKENRPPPNMRRTAASDSMIARKPLTLADVQNSVSELLEDPRVMVPDSQFSESEDEDEAPAQDKASRKPIVDRLSLSRTPSISSGDAGNMAFHAPSRVSAGPGFRVPSLIRQATSNLSTKSERSSGASTPTETTVRRGGTGRSNIHAQAREAERRALLDKKDGKRKEALRKKVEGGRKRAGGIRSVLGDLNGGFE